MPRVALLRRGVSLQATLIACAGVYVAAFVSAGAARLFFPYPLEITEGASLEAVRGILAGQPLYSQPTPEHVPLIYGPVYFYAAALVAFATGGPSFAALRLVSLLASIGSIGLTTLLVRRETGSAALGKAEQILQIGSELTVARAHRRCTKPHCAPTAFAWRCQAPPADCVSPTHSTPIAARRPQSRAPRRNTTARSPVPGFPRSTPCASMEHAF